ncbi:unnamed protein product [Commensalibacter communis]|uniref:Uncharacterized protein n=1 Tax=Commensalibacter communis TaxID=2972786 RepID=A0A9W4TRB7_9PROT|nr:hypothetical protein [Commensalibacter communis]CAI3953864.1 unnamed protein product [Commensalibacter communis]CAI3956317.1 unnamed protein product [Commensalibacter communis]CAI3956703.1 unnamed protein product [Commensalibacter communis]CAI3956962.1 unnamed protein product [Commensalibacter communis]
MKIDKNYAFELLQKLEEIYPEALYIYTLSKIENPVKPTPIKNHKTTKMLKNEAHIKYLCGEDLVKTFGNSDHVILTSKAINLLTDGIDMESWIKKKLKHN